MASASKTLLNPLRSRHASQGTLVLPLNAAAGKMIAVAAARPIHVTTTNVTPFSPSGAFPEPVDRIETMGDFLAVTPSTTALSTIESARMTRRGSATDGLNGSQRSQRFTDDGSPTASRRRLQVPTSSRGTIDVRTFDESDSSSSLLTDKSSTSARKRPSPADTPVAPIQHARSQPPRQHADGHATATGAPQVIDPVYGDAIETEAVRNLCLLLDLDKNDVRRLRRKFNDEDGDNTDTITQSAFFFLIGEERHNLSQRLFRLSGLPPTQSRLSFDQFLTIVATFATFTEAELLKFFYDVYCADTKSGVMLPSEIQSLGDELRAVNKGLAKNITTATKKMVSSRNVMAVTVASTPSANQQQLDAIAPTDFSFADFEKLVKKNLVAFYPLIRMQRNLRRATVSETFWVAKTREKQAVQATLAYMQTHQGRTPELSIKDRLVTSLFRRETNASRTQTLAKKIYAGQLPQR